MKSLSAILFALILISLPNLSGSQSASPLFPIEDAGTEFPVSYEKYGTFSGIGSSEYKYTITDRAGLRIAVGAGLYPNNRFSFSKTDSYFKQWNRANPKGVNQWEFVNSGNPKDDYYAWVAARGVSHAQRLLFTAQALLDAGYHRLALKAYYAVLVHFPKEVAWAEDRSYVWYPASKALSQISGITRHYPDIGYKLVGAKFQVINGKDTDLKNDEFVIDPGEWVPFDLDERIDLSGLEVIEKRGRGEVRLVQYENKHWQLLVDNEPYVIRGITYSPTTIGESISDGQGNVWMKRDADENGRIDTAYDTWVDKNRNGQQDPNEPSEGDFELMQKMGINTIRLYRTATDIDYDPFEFNKKLLRDMTRRYGIKAIMGDFVGAYTVGSGATWEDGTDYTDPEQLDNMRMIVRDYVEDHRDEPYVLMWLLGNENLVPSDYSGVNATRTQASIQVREYLTFINELARMIHRIDPDHPVAVGNIDLFNLEEHAKFAPEIDIYGTNVYRGSLGFGDVWSQVSNTMNRPVIIMEYGCDAFDSRKGREDQKAQVEYHRGNWNDILVNLGGRAGEGNSLGGVAFEFLDEWWKSSFGPWTKQSKAKDFAMAFPDGWANEEWFGVFSQGEGLESPLLRQPRKVYNLYKDELWADDYDY